MKPPDGLSLRPSNRQASIQWRQTFGGVRIPKGAYRLASHEEAHEWLWKMITRPPGSYIIEPREPTVEDLALNRLEVRDRVAGGLAMRASGFVRQTMDIDLVVAADRLNETRLYQALEVSPDKASRTCFRLEHPLG